MNILHIISSRGWGGAENSAAYLAKAQIDHLLQNLDLGCKNTL